MIKLKAAAHICSREINLNISKYLRLMPIRSEFYVIYLTHYRANSASFLACNLSGYTNTYAHYIDKIYLFGTMAAI
jgi:hypothetical protein